MNNKTCIGIIILGLLFMSGCQSYSLGTYQTHPCEAPYTYNISCKDARACLSAEVGMHTIEYYIEDYCGGVKDG